MRIGPHFHLIILCFASFFPPPVHVEREGSSVDAALLVGQGNASLTLARLKVSDEGTYICTVSTGLYQAQQVIQLHVTRESL